MEQQDDLYFVEQVLEGNKQAFAFIINRYKNRLYGMVLRMVKNPEDAKDLVQECFIKVYGQLEKYDRKGTFASWLYRVSVNHCMDTFRKKKVDTVEYSDETGSGSLTPEVVYLQKEKYRQLENLLATLKKEDRIIVLLKYTNDLSYEEIGEVLNIPVHTVANKIHRAKNQLRKNIKREEGGYFHEMFRI
ncbi:sigma-70 family RNA polymerase sigma factor [Sutcliffiella horikoshii]|uniref:RNA polymerase sigma factor n=1 Tax=Sutcliffiella horikoshii TaxID=79883 RepID=UPI0007D05F03|nr:sigma-70 family RNA polymerase sigma factor [Sutcliffiella horikoshii]MCM3620208.1 sigma-70 family RNA polymerase sigma factor [Sutcliffiella horikoshii]